MNSQWLQWLRPTSWKTAPIPNLFTVLRLSLACAFSTTMCFYLPSCCVSEHGDVRKMESLPLDMKMEIFCKVDSGKRKKGISGKLLHSCKHPFSGLQALWEHWEQLPHTCSDKQAEKVVEGSLLAWFKDVRKGICQAQVPSCWERWWTSCYFVVPGRKILMEAVAGCTE